MTISRRRFTSGTIAGAIASTIDMPNLPLQAAPAAATTLPPLAVIALNRLAYGPRPGDLEAFNSLGANDTARLTAWVDQQLAPTTIDDSACDQVVANARLKMRYSADSTGRYPATNEARPLNSLAKATPELWPLTDFSKAMDFGERQRPFYEVRVATWLRATYSKRQLYEVLVEFWHNHFNVNGTGEVQVSATFPVYDRDVIRKNALGNFRTFLEEVAKSTAMMYYLDNYNNKTAPGEGGNENYARELFELHCFGTDNYLKFYDDRSKIGTITYKNQIFARGYIDDDVYEASSCLGGWSIANNDPNNGTISNDGTYFFKTAFHYDGVKEVLGTIIRTKDFPSPEGEGKKVFDMLAGHPLVAKTVIGKMCRRLISDDISGLGTLIDQAVDVWMANLTAPDQLKQVFRTLIISAEFQAAWGKKVKRPYEAVISFLRATNGQLPVDQISVNGNANDGGYWNSLFWQVSATGHRIFEWPTPTGHPDIASYWISTNSTLRRWNLPYILTQSWGGNVSVPDMNDWDPTTDLRTVTQIVDAWIARLFGYSISAATRSEFITFFAYGGDANQAPKPTKRDPDWGDDQKTKGIPGLKDRHRALVQLMAASPEFHNR